MTAIAKRRRWAVLNAGGLLFALTANGLANSLPINGVTTGEVSDAYPNLFTPAAVTFSIWGLIYALLAFFVFWQFGVLKRREGKVLEKIGFWFVLSCLANGAWIVAWHYGEIGWSLGLMLVLLASLSVIVSRVRRIREVTKGAGRVAVRWAFSIYLGWISVATIANVTVLLVSLKWDGFGLPQEFWTVLVLLAAVGLALTAVLKHGDLAYALVVVWAFVGILYKRHVLEGPADMGILAASGGGILVILAAGVRRLARDKKRR